MEALAKQYPDSYWQFHADTEFSMMDVINEKYPVKALNYNLGDHGMYVYIYVVWSLITVTHV